jgi:hypothetical protein
MNILKVLLIGFTGLGLGFTTTDLITDDASVAINQNDESIETGYRGCYHYGGIDTFFEQFSEKDQQLINDYLETLLIENDLSMETFVTDFNVHHDIMYKVHLFIEEQGFEYDNSDITWHRPHMGGWSR